MREPLPSTKPKREWYGGPLLAAYAAPPLGFALMEATGKNPLPVFVALFAAPIDHWANHRSGSGWLALFMQPIFAGAGYLVAHSDCHGDCTARDITGAAVGYAGWVALDVAALAYKPVKEEGAAFALSPLRAPGARGLEVDGVF